MATSFDVAAVETLRAREYARLDAQGHVYLDYTGAGLYAASQLREHLELLSRTAFGNPHATNPTSMLATHYAERARASVLDFFNAPADDYTVIFTANASAALKLVAEAYPFGPGGRLVLTADNHNSVNGMREFARARGAQVSYVPLQTPELRVDVQALEDALFEVRPRTTQPSPDALRHRRSFGAVRASVGTASTPADIARFLQFVRTFAS